MNKQDWKYVFRIVLDFAKRNKWTIGCLAVSAAVRAVRPFLTVVLMGYLLDAVRAGWETSALLQLCLSALGINMVLQITESRARECYNQKLEYMKEIEAYRLNEKSLSMDYEYLEDIHVQELRIRSLSKVYLGVVGQSLHHMERMVTAGLSVIIALGILLPMFMNKNEGAFGFAGTVWMSVLLFAAMGLLVWINYKRGLFYTEEEMKIYNGMSGEQNKTKYYLDMLAGAESQKDLRNYGQQAAIEKDVEQLFLKLGSSAQKAGRIHTKREWMGQTTSDLSGLLVYLFTGFRAYAGMISIGQVVTYASSIIQFSKSVADFANNMGWIKAAALAGRDYADYMDLNRKKYEGTIPVEKRRDNRFLVEFEHVSFRYPGMKTDVIKDLNLTFTIGEKMAIVGKNGSGKTTFIKLLCRLYDVTEGCIKVNGIDIRKYNYQEYLKLFAVVFQDFRMFAFPLGENIAASETVDKKSAEDALVRAGLGKRLSELPQGLDTFVGKEVHPEGITFSGGEKQKMAIARAIYKDAPFIIMDEPTAALDPVSECDVYAGFDKMVGKKTALYISHRLASCRFCEDILVFDKGKVVQRGSHEELAAQEGLYSELWNAQAQYYQN